MSKATILFHQGFTDIINHLPILSYYVDKFSKISVIIRPDASNILKYYINANKYTNIDIIEIEKSIIDYYLVFNKLGDLFLKFYNLEKTYLLFFGTFDELRNDSYKNKFYPLLKSNIFFCDLFYKAYDFEYSNRINWFSYERLPIENEIFNQFCLKHSFDLTKEFEYILYHEDISNKVLIDFDKKSEAISINKMSDNFFDCLKILENAKELHLIDSSWACILYLMDAKYGIMKNKRVNLYAKRGYGEMFRSPKPLLNWNIISG
jgi:hypothetical protein